MEFGKQKTFENCSVNILDYIPNSHICTATRATSTLSDAILQKINAFVSDLESTLEGH